MLPVKNYLKMKNKIKKENKSVQPSKGQYSTRKQLLELYKSTPIPDESILDNLEVYMRPQRISEILTLEKLYSKILNVHGVVIEFGVRWGRHLSVFSALRATYEPYNFYRKILGFDTFTGFLDHSDKDGGSGRVFKGSMAVSKGYEEHLNKILAMHESEAPLSHIKRYFLFKGDAPKELRKYLKDNPETIVALAYFDMDVYEPTKKCLEIMRPYLSKGSVLAFDELMHPEFPGESLALREVFDINKYKIERFSTSPYPAYITI